MDPIPLAVQAPGKSPGGASKNRSPRTLFKCDFACRLLYRRGATQSPPGRFRVDAELCRNPESARPAAETGDPESPGLFLHRPLG